MPELSLQLDPFGGLWPVIPATATSPDDEPVIDFGALIQVQARLDEPPAPTPGTPQAAPMAMLPTIDPVIALPPAQQPTDLIELVETPVIATKGRPSATMADAIEVNAPAAVDVDVAIEVEQAPPVLPNVVMQTTPQQAPTAAAAPVAQHSVAPVPAPTPAPTLPLAPAVAPASAAALAPAPASVTEQGPVPAVAPEPMPPHTPAAAPAPTPVATPTRSAPVSAQSLDAAALPVIPKTQQATTPSFNRVDHTSIARAVPTPQQSQKEIAPASQFDAPPKLAEPLPYSEQPSVGLAGTAGPKLDGPAENPAPSIAPSAVANAPIAQVTPSVQAPPAPNAPVAQAPLQAMVPTTEDGTPVMPRLVEMMRWQAQEGGGQAELRLRPELLGAVTVSIVVEHGAVKAIVSAETAAALEYLRAESSGLQEALEERGLTLDEFEVREESPLAERRRDDDEAPAREDAAPPAPRRRARDEDGDAVFSVLM